MPGSLARPTTPIPPSGLHGFVVAAPDAAGDPFTVKLPNFDDEHVFEIRRYSSRGATLPAAGDEVLVVEDDNEEPWVAAWWPAGGDAPGGSSDASAALAADGIGMIIGPGPRPPGFAFAHAIYVSVEEPVDAQEFDQWIKPE